MPLGFKEGKVFFPQVVKRCPLHKTKFLSDFQKLHNSIAQSGFVVKNLAKTSSLENEARKKPKKRGNFQKMLLTKG